MSKVFDMEAIGRNISGLRKKNNLTQMELADQLGISYQAISSWERGLTMPDVSKLPEIASILGVTVDEILLSEKGARILSSLEEGGQPERVTPEELVEVAPLLRPGQVDQLAMAADSGFTDEQAEQLLPLMSFSGKYGQPDEELAEEFYNTDAIAFFAIIARRLSKQTQEEFAVRACEERKIEFFAVLSEE